jgi:tetratricopeptide (TPR) repeat protein
MPAHFLGRDEIVETLVTRLIAGNTLSLSAEGLPGVGKTTLAVALAHHRSLLEHFDGGVLWAGLGQQPDVLGALASWAGALEIDVTHLASEADRAQALKNAIGQRHLLLVIDDAWHYDAARFLHCGGPNCCHLLTTRDQSIARKFAGPAQTTSVPELEPDPAFALLQALAPEACAADPQTAQELAQVVGGLPLALELLGGYLAEPEHSYFPELTAEAWEEMRDPQRRLQLASQRLGAGFDSPQVTLKETIELSLSGLPSEAVRAFYALGAFAPKPEQFTLEAAQAITEVDIRTIALLASRNLVERADKEGTLLALHQTLTDVARARMDAEAIVRHRDYYLAHIKRDEKDWRTIEATYGQIQAAWNALQDNQIILEYVSALYIYQTYRGLWHAQLSWSKRGLAAAEALDDLKVMSIILNNIGLLYQDSGYLQEALSYYQQSLATRAEVNDGELEAGTLNNIAGVYYSLNNTQEALNSYQQALAISKQARDRQGEAIIINNIGSIYIDLGLIQKALNHFRQALSIAREIGYSVGEGAALKNIGGVHYRRGETKQALEYMQQSLLVRRRAGHRAGEAGSLQSIGEVYNSAGRTREALAYFQQALIIYKEVGDRAGESSTYYRIANIYQGQSRLAEVASLLRRIIDIRDAIQHPDLEQNRAELAKVEAILAAQQRAGGEES